MDQIVDSILKEIELRSIENQNPIKTIYFGGGTPSAIGVEYLNKITTVLNNHFDISQLEEFTLEVNPDDVSIDYLQSLKSIGVTRLSIGVQSFFETHLHWMNRSHNAAQAVKCIDDAIATGFQSSSVDLIYGFEKLSEKEWMQNTKLVLNSGLNHASCYALTIEEKTPFAKMQKSSKQEFVNDSQAWEQFKYIHDQAIELGWDHYEISNFAKENNHSKHNQSYWQGKPYIGLGPGAHSFDGVNKRSWNFSDNWKYIDQMSSLTHYTSEFEVLNATDILNEKIMVGLRTKKGIPIEYIKKQLNDSEHPIHNYIKHDQAILENENCSLSLEGWWISDAIIASLFQEY